MGGDFILGQCKQYLEDKANIELVPYYMIKSKEAVKPNEPPKFIRRELQGLTESYKRFMLKVIKNISVRTPVRFFFLK